MTSQADIAPELQRLLDTLPPPRGVSFEKAFPAYVDALIGFPVEVIHEAISRYLSGEFTDLSLKFYPRAPELGSICRRVRSERAAEADKQRRAIQQEAERLKEREAETLRRNRTPEEMARVDELLRQYRTGVPITRRFDGPVMRSPPRGSPAPPLRDPTRDPYFVARTRDPYAARVLPAPPAAEDEPAAVRERYGMSDEELAKLPDAKPLPKGMQQLAATLPALPAPADDPFEGVEDL